MTIVKLAMAVDPSESVTRTVNGKVPNTVGVPEIKPAAFRERPEGKDPDIRLHE
jgi:hypothetical protein